MRASSLIARQTPRVAEDDSPFLSMADFFSLISLSLIYAMIVLAPQTPVPKDAIAVVSAHVASSEQQSTLDPRFAFVHLSSDGDGFRVSVQWPAQQLKETIEVSSSEKDLDAAAAWLESTLARYPDPVRLVLSMHDDEKRAEAHRLLNWLAQSEQQRLATSVVFLRKEPKE